MRSSVSLTQAMILVLLQRTWTAITRILRRPIRLMSHWKTIETSIFPHEREALEFLKSGVSSQSKVSAWSNFEFMADTGSLYEVDALIVSPWGAFLVEIKSRPGAGSGLGNMWSWHQDGKSYSADNPLLLTVTGCTCLLNALSRANWKHRNTHTRHQSHRKSDSCTRLICHGTL